MRVSTLEIFLHHFIYDRTKETMLCLTMLIIVGLEGYRGSTRAEFPRGLSLVWAANIESRTNRDTPSESVGVQRGRGNMFGLMPAAFTRCS